MKKAYKKPFVDYIPVAAPQILTSESDTYIPVVPKEPDPEEGGDEYGLSRKSEFTFDGWDTEWE